MDFVSFYVYCSERPGRTEVFTGSAAYAPLLVDDRYLYRDTFFFRVSTCPVTVAVSVPDLHHLYGSCRAVPCAVAAFHAVGKDYTVFLDPDGMAYLDG